MTNTVTSNTTLASAFEKALAESSHDIVNVMGVDIAKDGDEWSIVNKGTVVSSNILSGAKDIAKWLWKWIKKIASIVVGWLQSLFATLAKWLTPKEQAEVKASIES